MEERSKCNRYHQVGVADTSRRGREQTRRKKAEGRRQTLNRPGGGGGGELVSSLFILLPKYVRWVFVPSYGVLPGRTLCKKCVEQGQRYALLCS